MLHSEGLLSCSQIYFIFSLFTVLYCLLFCKTTATQRHIYIRANDFLCRFITEPMTKDGAFFATVGAKRMQFDNFITKGNQV